MKYKYLLTLIIAVAVSVAFPNAVFAKSCSLQYDGDSDGTVTVSDVLGLLGEFGMTCAQPFTMVGRWVPNGLGGSTCYEFTETLRYTIYSIDGPCGGIEEAIPNPNPWHMEGDSIVIDLHFGNEYVGLVVPGCDGQMVELIHAEGWVQTLVEEGVDAGDCD